MKLESVQKTAIIKVALEDLSEYHRVLSHVIDQTTGGDWDGAGIEVLERLKDHILTIINDVCDY